MTEPARGSGFRTLTEALRHTQPDSVVTLLQLRPDLSQPVPHDLADLTVQATTSRSVARALDGLTAWQRQAAEGLAALPDPTTVEALTELLGTDPDPVRQAVDDLRQRALLWGPDRRLHLVRAVREQFGPYPGALAPPSVRPLPPDRVADLVADCGPGVGPVLERLAWSPTGSLAEADRDVSPEAARGPVEQLLARRLLHPLNAETVILPREVAWYVRGGRFAQSPIHPDPPPVLGRSRRPELIDRAAAGAAYGLVHDLEEVGHILADRPHRLLRDGGLGQRDVIQLARDLDGDAAHTSFLLECGAVTVLAAAPNGQLLPTREFDAWIRRPAVDRWLLVARAWLDSDRLFSRSAQPDSHPLGPEADLSYAATLRQLVIRLLLETGIGVAPEPADLAAAVRWHRPRLGRVPLRLEQGIEWILLEAGWLGLTAMGATSSLTTLLTAGEAPVPESLGALFPEPVETIIVQADLTAVAAGPLPHQLAAELRLLADQESRGGGGVYRFSSDSLRRGFDAGWSATRIQSWLEQHSTTGIPQPLSYLIDDVARHHGSIRVGAAESYLTVADPVRVAALLAEPAAAALGLRQVGPGVLISAAQPEDVTAFLRRLGHHPAADQDPGRAPASAPRAPIPERDRPEPSAAEVIARTVLAGESPGELARESPGEPSARRDRADDDEASTAETLHRLHAAVRLARPVRLRMVAANGQPTERRLSPLDLAGGQLRGVDLSTAQVVSIPLARVLFASELDSGQLD